jgi:hypothetical protein
MKNEEIENIAKETDLYKENSHSKIIQRAIQWGFRDGYNYSEKTTPFVSRDGQPISVGDYIEGVFSERSLKKSIEEPMLVCFGEYKAGKDDWNVEFICYGYYIKFADEGVYSLTQNGEGYSISAKDCKIVTEEIKAKLTKQSDGITH